MATPKKKISKSRRNMRRFAAGNRLDKTNTSMTCKSCNEPTRPHRVCKCGFYAGKQIIASKKAQAQA